MKQNFKFDNDAAKVAKVAIKNYFADYSKQLQALWAGLKAEDLAFQSLNNVISGIAGGKGENVPTYLVKHFWHYIDKDGNPYNRRRIKGTKDYEYKPVNECGQYARGILKKAALNCIESARKGTAFKQEIIEK